MIFSGTRNVLDDEHNSSMRDHNAKIKKVKHQIPKFLLPSWFRKVNKVFVRKVVTIPFEELIDLLKGMENVIF